MARSIVDQLSSLMASEISVRPHLTDNRFGEDTHGPAVTIQGRLKNGHKIVKDRTGQEVVSRVQFWAAGVFGLTADDEYTLPAPWTPSKPQAVAVELITDENGPHHEVVMFK